MLIEALDIRSQSRHHSSMRTTLSIDDDVLAQVKQLAAGRATSLGRTASDLLRRALEADCATTTRHGLTVLDPGERSALVPSATVRRLVEEEP
jgi:negative regulator of replication initiation